MLLLLRLLLFSAVLLLLKAGWLCVSGVFLSPFHPFLFLDAEQPKRFHMFDLKLAGTLAVERTFLPFAWNP